MLRGLRIGAWRAVAQAERWLRPAALEVSLAREVVATRLEHWAVQARCGLPLLNKLTIEVRVSPKGEMHVDEFVTVVPPVDYITLDFNV